MLVLSRLSFIIATQALRVLPENCVNQHLRLGRIFIRGGLWTACNIRDDGPLDSVVAREFPEVLDGHFHEGAFSLGIHVQAAPYLHYRLDMERRALFFYSKISYAWILVHIK